MAKDKTSYDIAVEAADNLIKLGLPVSAELQEVIDSGASDKAFHYLSEKVITPLADENDNAAGRKARNAKVTEWQVRMFALAADMDSDFRADEKNVGRGKQIERFASVECPEGTIVIRLRADVPVEKSE